YVTRDAQPYVHVRSDEHAAAAQSSKTVIAASQNRIIVRDAVDCELGGELGQRQRTETVRVNDVREQDVHIVGRVTGLDACVSARTQGGPPDTAVGSDRDGAFGPSFHVAHNVGISDHQRVSDGIVGDDIAVRSDFAGVAGRVHAVGAIERVGGIETVGPDVV